ncbi:TPA: glycosyltransferase family 4 protein, partial [Streptococcus suis]
SPQLFPFINVKSNKFNKLEAHHIEQAIEKINPDIIHIHGTEYIHSLLVARLAKAKSIPVVCSIQGLTSIISKHFLQYIPQELYKKWNISSIFRRTLLGQKKQLQIRGRSEVETLGLISNIIGRTEWDRACTYFINPERNYYFCNESLRDEFYSDIWCHSSCKQRTIFVSQASSPLKGFNILIESLALVKNIFPDVKIRVAGNDLTNTDNFISKMKLSVYGGYISKLLQKHNLHSNVEFLGQLDAVQMKDELLNCNIFVSPSSIENSSNSVCEAMLLGVPVISSYVGGIPSLLVSNETGLLYQGESPEMLSYMIIKLFSDKNFASYLGFNAREVALSRHNQDENCETIISIYNDVLEKAKKYE